MVSMVSGLFGSDGRAAGPELAGLVGDWGPLLGQVAQPTRVWAGTQDDVHPVSMGRHLQGRIARSELTIVDGGFLAVSDRFPELLRWATAPV